MAEIKDILVSGDIPDVIATNAPILPEHLARKDYVDSVALSAKFKKEEPGTITVAMGPTLLLAFSEDMPAGVYEITVSLVTSYTSKNDKFTWFVDGTFASPVFLKECKVADTSEPLTYAFPVDWAGGVIEMNIYGGALDSDVDVPAVNVIAKRIG